MNDRNRRSAAEVMANAARVVKAAVNIVRAAIAGGLHGAAAAAAKELLPTIIKFAVGVLIAIIVIPNVRDLCHAEYVFRLRNVRKGPADHHAGAGAFHRRRISIVGGL